MQPDGYQSLDDFAVRSRFERKLKTFCADYDLADRSALVVQSCPADTSIELDLADAALRVALAQGER